MNVDMNVCMCFGLWQCVCANIELSVCLDWRGYKQLCFCGEHKGNKFVFIRMCVSGCVTYLNFCGQNWWTSVPTIWLNLLVPQIIIMYLINAKSFGDRFVYIENNWLSYLFGCLSHQFWWLCSMWFPGWVLAGSVMVWFYWAVLFALVYRVCLVLRSLSLAWPAFLSLALVEVSLFLVSLLETLKHL